MKMTSTMTLVDQHIYILNTTAFTNKQLFLKTRAQLLSFRQHLNSQSHQKYINKIDNCHALYYTEQQLNKQFKPIRV